MENHLPELSGHLSLNHAGHGKAAVAIFVARDASSLPHLQAPVSLNHGADDARAPAMVFVARD